MIIQTVFQPTIQEIMKNGSLLVSFNIIVKLRKSIFGENIYIKLTDRLTQIMACLIYTFSLSFSSSFAFQTGKFTSSLYLVKFS